MLIVLLHNSWQKGCVMRKLIQTMKRFPFPYTWPVNLGSFEAVLCIQMVIVFNVWERIGIIMLTYLIV